MADLTRHMPELTGEEAQYIGSLLADMSDEQATSFTFAYRSQRRVELTFLIMTVFHIGRFYLGHIGMAIAYLVTFSFCGIGWIADLINHKKLVADYNKSVAQRLVNTLSATGVSSPAPAAPYTPPQTPPTPSPIITESLPVAVPLSEQPEGSPEQPATPTAPEPLQETAPETQLTDTVFDTLERLASLHERGILTDEEFQAQKDRLLNS